MRLTSKLDFKLTKARFRMLSSSSSKFRSIPKALLIIPMLSVLTFLFCVDSSNIYENLSANELGEMFPGSYNDIELTKTDERLWIDEDGELYSGTQKVYKIDTDQLVYIHQFKDGFLIETTFYNLNPEGLPVITGAANYSLDSDGNLITQIFSETDQDSMSLFVQFTEYENTRNSKYYFRNGSLMSDKTMLWPGSGDSLRYHGLVTEYDQEGNITKQERYDNGELMETIK